MYDTYPRVNVPHVETVPALRRYLTAASPPGVAYAGHSTLAALADADAADNGVSPLPVVSNFAQLALSALPAGVCGASSSSGHNDTGAQAASSKKRKFVLVSLFANMHWP